MATCESNGGVEAEKQYPRPDKRWCSTMNVVPTQKPPIEATEFSNVEQIKSTSSGYNNNNDAIRNLFSIWLELGFGRNGFNGYTIEDDLVLKCSQCLH